MIPELQELVAESGTELVKIAGMRHPARAGGDWRTHRNAGVFRRVFRRRTSTPAVRSVDPARGGCYGEMMNEKLESAGAGALAVAAALADIQGAGGVKTAYDVFAFLRGSANEARVKAATDDLVARVAELGAYDKQEAENRFVALLAGCGKEVEDLLYDTHRAIALGKSRAAWPSITLLAADYLVNRGGVPDTFSRRAAWLLERCEDEDLVLLVAALTECRVHLDEATEGFHLLVAGNRLDVKPEHRRVTFDDNGMYLEGGHRRDVVPSGARDLLVLLRDSRLALLGGHQDSCFLQTTVARRLIRLFVHVA